MKHNWEYTDFNKIAQTITPNVKVDKSSYLENGVVPIVSQEDSLISGYWNNISDITPHKVPVIIFGDHSRVVKYVEFDFVVGADGVKIIQPKNCILTKFLYHYLKWYKVPSLGYSRHFKLLKEAKYPVPPMETQERIVAELDEINGLIEAKREQLKQLDLLSQSIFYTMFGDPFSNPKGWEVKRLNSVSSKIGSGATPRGGNQAYKKDGISLIRSLNIHNSHFKYENLAHIDNYQAKELSNVIVEPFDVLINITGASVARSYIVPNDVLPARVNQHVAIIRLIKGINYIFIHRQLINDSYQNLLLSMASKGATRESITKAQLEHLPVIIPPLALQEQFAAKVESIESRKADIEATIKELQTLLDSRMDYWFN